MKRRGVLSVELKREGIDQNEPWLMTVIYTEDARPNLRAGYRYTVTNNGINGNFRLHDKQHPIYKFHQVA